MAYFLFLISGAVGGNVAAAFLRRMNLGLFGNTVIGTFGGLAGGIAINSSEIADSHIAALLATVLGASAMGGLAVVVVGALRELFRRR